MATSVAYRTVSFPTRLSSGQPRTAVATGAAKSGGNGKWWASLVGWSGKADYLEAPAPILVQDETTSWRQFMGVMTEEKARELRARMAQTDLFHDAMYHSAIASRLARSA